MGLFLCSVKGKAFSMLFIRVGCRGIVCMKEMEDRVVDKRRRNVLHKWMRDNVNELRRRKVLHKWDERQS